MSREKQGRAIGVGHRTPGEPVEDHFIAAVDLVADQMQAGVARIDELDVVLRDIETGLIDFPALVSGRQVWLCWRLGEKQISFWHELQGGFGGRRPIRELEGAEEEAEE